MVSQAFLLKKVQPDYPEEARKNHVRGRVIIKIKAVISEAGDVEDLTLMSGDGSLARAALEAVKQWKYKPYYLKANLLKWKPRSRWHSSLPEIEPRLVHSNKSPSPRTEFAGTQDQSAWRT